MDKKVKDKTGVRITSNIKPVKLAEATPFIGIEVTLSAGISDSHKPRFLLMNSSFKANCLNQKFMTPNNNILKIHRMVHF